MGSRSRDRGGGECWGPGGRTFVTPLRYTNCSFTKRRKVEKFLVPLISVQTAISGGASGGGGGMALATWA